MPTHRSTRQTSHSTAVQANRNDHARLQESLAGLKALARLLARQAAIESLLAAIAAAALSDNRDEGIPND